MSLVVLPHLIDAETEGWNQEFWHHATWDWGKLAVKGLVEAFFGQLKILLIGGGGGGERLPASN